MYNNFISFSNPLDLVHTFVCTDGNVYIPRIVMDNLEIIKIIEEDLKATNNNTTNSPFDKKTVSIGIVCSCPTLEAFSPWEYVKNKYGNISLSEIQNIVLFFKYMGVKYNRSLSECIDDQENYNLFLLYKSKSAGYYHTIYFESDYGGISEFVDFMKEDGREEKINRRILELEKELFENYYSKRIYFKYYKSNCEIYKLFDKIFVKFIKANFGDDWKDSYNDINKYFEYNADGENFIRLIKEF